MRINWTTYEVTGTDEERDRAYRHSPINIIPVDAATGEELTKDMRWADDVTGEYEAVLRDSSGNFYCVFDDDGTVVPQFRDETRPDRPYGIATAVIKRPLRFVFPKD